MALGSSRAAIAWLIVRRGAAWTVVGLAGGLIGIAAMGYALPELLYRTSPHDPLTIGLAVVALGASGAIALLIPVRRASRMDPPAILR
jgi:ABC-type antimicrobial peptide transport system permease subunit